MEKATCACGGLFGGRPEAHSIVGRSIEIRRARSPEPMRTDGVPATHAFDPCAEEHAFRFATGARARSLDELARVLADVPLHAFDYHREHYWMWIRDVVRDEPLAERFRSYGASGMDGEELRRLFASLLERRLKELAERPPAAPRGERKARVVSGP